MIFIGDGFKGLCSFISGTTLSPLSPFPLARRRGINRKRGFTPLKHPFFGGEVEKDD